MIKHSFFLILVLMLAGVPAAADPPQTAKRPSGWTTEIEDLPLDSIALFYNTNSKVGVRFAPGLLCYFFNDDETNPDLADYRGYFNVGITVGKADGLVVDGNFGWAVEGPSAQVDLTLPLHKIIYDNLDLYLQVQYVNSLAESLLDYTNRTQALRIGFAIVR